MISIDILIVLAFLVINLILGLKSAKGIKTIKEFAIGNRDFSTAIITSTIVATYIAGSSFASRSTQTYKDGLYFIIPCLTAGFSFFVIAFMSSRMACVFDKLSVADYMGSLYGNTVKFITAVTGIIVSIGRVASQFVITVSILNSVFNIDILYASLFSATIIITYSSIGGIKAVTFTDVIQFSTFGIVIPTLIFSLVKIIGTEKISTVLENNPVFDLSQVFVFDNHNTYNAILLSLYFLFPGLDPAIFQRILMCKDIKQVKQSFLYAGIITTAVLILLMFIGLLILSHDPNINFNTINMVDYIMNNYLGLGMKGIFAIGILAMIMSTADSYINSAAVLFANDIFSSINCDLSEKVKLILVRFISALIGISALVISFFAKNLISISVFVYSCYVPVVSVPLILSIFGIRPKAKIILFGMISGFAAVVFFSYYTNISYTINYVNLHPSIPGICTNLSILLVLHYLSKQISKPIN